VASGDSGNGGFGNGGSGSGAARGAGSQPAIGGARTGPNSASPPRRNTRATSDASAAVAQGGSGAEGGSGDGGSGDGGSGDARPLDENRRRRRRPRSRSGSPASSAGSGGEDDLSISEADDYGIGPAGDEVPKGADVEVALEQQAEIAKGFLDQLTAEFGLQATVTVKQTDDDTVELQLTGSDLGILIGPKGATLLAVQNLTRTVVFNETGANNGHINVDVGGYRQKRTEALARFATQVAATVKQSGKRTALEPMSSVDRKVVHDTIAEIDGVSTISEGEEPRRRVVVLPD
jgi:spoIIIJ-associated protein